MENVHIRFTPYDISGYSFTWLDRYDKYAVFQEDVDDDGNPLLHFHIYIKEVHDCDKTVRNAITSNFKIPKVGRGQTNKYYALMVPWNDPDYIFKYGNQIRVKGFSEKEVLDRVVSGKQKYLDKVKPSVQGDTIIYEVASKKVTRVNLIKEIVTKVYEWYLLETKERDVTVKEIIQKVCSSIQGHGRGINYYQVRDITAEILYMDENKRHVVVDKIYSML